jgi:hypothetical protein
MKILLLALTALALRADTIGAPFVASNQTGAPGDTLTFTGWLANSSGSDLFINGAGINLAGFDPFDTDLTDFILNFTGISLNSGDSIGPFDFFTVTIPNPFADGLYAGTLTVQGGADDATFDTLATVDFAINVSESASSSTPEPGALPLLATASALLVLGRKIRSIFLARELLGARSDRCSSSPCCSLGCEPFV